MEVKGINLETKSGKRLTLSLDEARELHEQLDKLFGASTNTPVLPYPIFIEKRQPYWQDQVWSGDTIIQKGNPVTCTLTS